MESSLPNNKGMTFVEILVVMGIISILFASFFYIWNTMDVFRKSRDSKRINDLQLLDNALKTLLSTERNINLGEENIIYTSLPDSSSTCGSYNLIPLFSPYSYRCQTSQNYLKVDGNGWLPVNFTLGKILTVSVLPIDPLNNKDYFYAYQVRQGRYKLTARFENQININLMANDGGFEPTLYEVGSDLFIPSPHSGLVGYWNFDEGTGTIAYDLSGYASDGILKDATSTNADGNTPPQWKEGKINKALVFDGLDDFVDIPDLTRFNNPSGITYAAWINFNALPVNTQAWVIGYSDSALCEDITLGYDNGRLGVGFYFAADPEGGCANRQYILQNTATTSTWYYLVGVADYPNSKIYLYIDGKLVKWSTWSGSIITRTMDGTIGALHKTGGGVNQGYFFNGLIDEVRIYNRALSSEEIKAIYETTR